ncbi:MAG: secretin N-terminal domain-containing protein [candidate division Zixibacteria bacterium]
MTKAPVWGMILLLVAGIIAVSPGLVSGQVSSESGNLPDELKIGLAKTVTLDADDAFLPSILSILAEKSGFNIVTGPGVNTKERISVHLKDTPINEAINLVVRAAGLSYEVVGNSFLVAEADALEKEIGVEAHVIDLQYAVAAEVKELLKDLTEKIQIDTSGNRILILASPKVISEIKSIVASIDKPAPQILLEAKLIEVSTDDLDELGIDWGRLSHLTTILAESPLVKDDQGRTDGSSRAPDQNDFGGQLPDLDALPLQYGFEKVEGFDNIFQFSRQLNAFDITLDFLIKRNKARVLAHAQLTTMNNREATILIGETLKFAVSSRENAIVITDSVGIQMHITPTINSDGYITVKVNPEVSSIVELVQGLYPRKKIRTAKTTVLVKDGQQIFIGGLLAIDDVDVEYKMPILSNIPIIGKLFTHSYKATKKTDLLIEITPRIVRTDVSYSDAANITSQGNKILQEGVLTDFKSLDSEIKEMENAKSDIERIKKMQEEATTPLEERLKEKGY